MTHRILVLGAGYAGALAAGALARRLRPSGVDITLVNAVPNFVERIRLHQLAVGQTLPDRPLRDMFAKTDVNVVIDRVTSLEVDAHQVTLEAGGAVDYDSLIISLGSTQAPPALEVEGDTVRTVASHSEALRLRDSLSALDPGRSVVVVGAGLTGLEAVTEIAESRPDLDVSLLTGDEIGANLSAKGARHVRAVLSRLGVTVHERARAGRVTPDALLTEDGRSLPADLVVWTTGFVTNPLAAASSLATSEDGRIVVGRTMRSVSHPDVRAVGDAAWALGHGDKPLRMCCASGNALAWQAAEGVVADLSGGRAPSVPRAYVAQCISLGRRDGLLQIVRPDDTPRELVLTGRLAARNKEFVCKGAAFGVANPTFRIPVPSREPARVTV